jgi:hypothetical protein
MNMFGTSKNTATSASAINAAKTSNEDKVANAKAKLPAVIYPIEIGKAQESLIKQSDEFVLFRNVFPSLISNDEELYRLMQSSHGGNSVSGSATTDEALGARRILSLMKDMGGNYSVVSAKYTDEGMFQSFVRFVRRARGLGGFSRAQINKRLREQETAVSAH